METDSREQSSRSHCKPMCIRTIPPDEPDRLFPRHHACVLAVSIAAISKALYVHVVYHPTSASPSAITIYLAPEIPILGHVPRTERSSSRAMNESYSGHSSCTVYYPHHGLLLALPPFILLSMSATRGSLTSSCSPKAPSGPEPEPVHPRHLEVLYHSLRGVPAHADSGARHVHSPPRMTSPLTLVAS